MSFRAPIPRVASVCILVLAAACGSTRDAGGNATEKTIGERLVQLDPVPSGEGAGRFLEMTLKNAGDERVVTSCAPEWFDAKDAVVQSARDWHDVDLRPGAEIRLRFAPMPPSARSWRLRFRS